MVHTAGVLVRMRIFPQILGNLLTSVKIISVDLLRKLVVYCRCYRLVRSVCRGAHGPGVSWPPTTTSSVVLYLLLYRASTRTT